MTTNLPFFLIIFCSFRLRMRNVSDKSCRKNQNTRFVFNNLFFWKSCRLWENMEKYCRAAQAIWQCGAWELHAGYLRLQIHALKLCNTHCISTATMVARTRFSVTLYVHWLSCYVLFKLLKHNTYGIYRLCSI